MSRSGPPAVSPQTSACRLAPPPPRGCGRSSPRLRSARRPRSGQTLTPSCSDFRAGSLASERTRSGVDAGFGRVWAELRNVALRQLAEDLVVEVVEPLSYFLVDTLLVGLRGQTNVRD